MAVAPNLPLEVAERLLHYMEPLDRLAFALTSSVWTETVNHAMSMEDVWLLIQGFDVQDAMNAICESRRRYRNFRFHGVDLSQVHERFWVKAGQYINRLEFESCVLTSESFHKILWNCPELKSIKFKASEIGVRRRRRLLAVDEGAHFEKIRNSVEGVQELSFDGMSLHKKWLHHLLRMMPNLKSLRLRDIRKAEFPNLVPLLLRTEHSFTALDLTCSSQSEIQHVVIRYSATLQELKLKCTDFTPQSYHALSFCRRLQCLELREAEGLEDYHVMALVESSPMLEDLRFISCDVDEEELWPIFSLKNLRYLCVSDCVELGDDAMIDLGAARTLRHLFICETHVPDSFIRSIAQLTELRELALSRLYELTGNDLDIICTNFKNLEYLELENCSQLTAQDGVKFHLLENLKYLNIQRCLGLTDLSFERGLGSPAMEYLNIEQCPLTDTALENIANHHRHLTHLFLNDCNRITDVGLSLLLERQTGLKGLVLDSCSSLRDQFLMPLLSPTISRKLLYVMLKGEWDISPGLIQLFKEKRPSVKLLAA